MDIKNIRDKALSFFRKEQEQTQKTVSFDKENEPLLRLENIVKTFNEGTVNEITVFDGFNLNLNQGDFVSVVGSNGSGKTTLLNLISGTLTQNSGRIILKNSDIKKEKEFIRARRIGRVFQDPSKGTAPSMTIAENLSIADNKGKPYNLTFGLNKKRENHFKEQLSRLKLGLEDKLYTPVSALSGGQRQALSLLIATMSDIDLILLDEHTAALDPSTSEHIMVLTKEFIEEKKLTALMVTHNLKFAVEYGTRLVMLDRGKIVVDKDGKEKENLQIQDVLSVFNEISIECGN